jgi:hypothetical protein
LQGIALAGVFQIIISETGRRTVPSLANRDGSDVVAAQNASSLIHRRSRQQGRARLYDDGVRHSHLPRSGSRTLAA